MASKSDLRCAIEVDGRPRRLFSVRERTNGDLLIRIASAAVSQNAGRPPIVEERYSVHRSASSPTQINVIKHTLKLGNGELHETGSYVGALKQRGQFAVIYHCRTPDLAAERYVLDRSEREIWSLGVHRPSEFSLYYTLLVSQRDRAYESPAAAFNVSSRQFSDFRLTVLWAFGYAISDETGLKLHPKTFPPGAMAVDGVQDETASGLDETAANLFVPLCWSMMRDQYLAHLEREYGCPELHALSRALGFFR